MKRSRTDTLTGGTGDVSPQQLTVFVQMTATDTFASQQITIPISRVPVRKGRAIVWELLKVFYNLPELDQNPPAGGGAAFSQFQLSTVNLGDIDFNDPRTVTFGAKFFRGAFTAGGSYMFVTEDPQCNDLTDGAGHGVLVATDSIFVGLKTSGFLGPASMVVKFLYRFKEVSLEEYIGIVQSQQD